LGALSAHAATVPSVSLSIVGTGGSWTVYAQTDTAADNVGIADYAIDVIGSGGAVVPVGTPTVSGSFEDAPTGTFTSKSGTKTVTTDDGFVGSLNSNGAGATSNGGDGIGIAGEQNFLYNGANSVNSDKAVIQGFGKVASTAAPYTGGVTWSVPSDIASGSYTGNGTLTVTAAAGSEGFQTLNIVSGGLWQGPGNVSTDITVPASTTVTSGSTPPPVLFTLSGTSSMGDTDIATSGATVTPILDDKADVITESGGHGNDSYDSIKIHEPGNGVSSPSFQFTGFAQGDNIDVLLKFSNTSTGGDPVAGDAALLSDIQNYINNNDAGQNLSVTTTIPANVAAAFPGISYDLMVSTPAPAGDPFADFNFSGFTGDGLSAGQLGVSDLGIVPEPTSLGLLMLGGVGLVGRRRNKKEAK
jgi:hypothetical protein